MMAPPPPQQQLHQQQKQQEQPLSSSPSTRMRARTRLQLETEVPSGVYALNLAKLSSLSGIDEAELVRAMQSEDAVEMQGVVVDRGQEVPFEAVGKHPLLSPPQRHAVPMQPQRLERGAHHPRVREVLITAASSTMCLEGSDTPKCLIQLGEFTLIEHILAQLFVAGMTRVVIIISHYGHEIMEHVKASVLFHKLQIEFVNLGEETSYGHARTVLSAREMFTKPFLIHTADHIFDKAILRRMAEFDLGECVACVLVDSDPSHLRELPSTAGKIQLHRGPTGTTEKDSDTIQLIGRHLTTFDAVDAGLFLTTGRIFSALELLAYEKPRFSLAEALSVLRPSYGLKYVETAGDVYLSVETQEQYQRIITNDLIASLSSPWPVFVAKDVVDEDEHENESVPSKNVFLAVSSADDESHLRVVDSQDRQVFEGFIVGVNHLEVDGDGLDMDDGGEDGMGMGTTATLNERTPLLGPGSPLSRSGRRSSSASGLQLQRRKSSFLEQAEESFVLSIPFEPSSSTHQRHRSRKDQLLQSVTDADSDSENGAAVTPLASSTRNAYLIELPPTATRSMGDIQQHFVLAVPGSDDFYTKPSLLRKWSSLPSNIKDVAVEALELENGALEVQLRVQRQVPVVGYVLLLTSLVTIASMGAAVDMQEDVHPFLKLFWRSSASLLVFLPLAGVAVYDQGMPQLTTHMMFQFVACCVSYAVFMMTFLWALTHTSIGHAYIFNNCHSLLMVLGRLLVGQSVTQFEGTGTGIGILGGIITTMDHTQTLTQRGDAVIPISLAGDIVALIGAVGGAVYLLTARRLREKVDVIVLMSGVFIVTMLLHFPVFSLLEIPFEFSMDARIGLFGWVQAEHVGSELYIVIVCTLVGTLGYIAVMKYFDPIVVSVVMLLEPVLANAMGIAVGVDVLPGLYTFGGAALIMLGTALVIVSNASRTESINATAAMSSTTAALPKSVSTKML